MIPVVRTGIVILAAWFVGVATCLNVTEARGGRSIEPRQEAGTTAGDLEVLELRPNFFMIAGAGGHIGVQVGEDGVVVVDAGSAAASGAVVAAIKKITTRPIRYVINTSADPDHVGGNEAVSKAGQTLFTAPGSISLPASILSAEKVLERMGAPAGKASPFPVGSWPTETFDHPRKYMYLNGEGIEILHQPAAHTDGDVLVFFLRSHVPPVEQLRGRPRAESRRRLNRYTGDRIGAIEIEQVFSMIGKPMPVGR